MKGLLKRVVPLALAAALGAFLVTAFDSSDPSLKLEGVVGPPAQAPDAPPAGAEVFRAAEVTRKAVITARPEPNFTEEARRNNVAGVVRLRAVLRASGEVTNVAVLKGLPDGLTEEAVAAARQIRFMPAQKDGRPVSQRIVIEYNFNIY